MSPEIVAASPAAPVRFLHLAIRRPVGRRAPLAVRAGALLVALSAAGAQAASPTPPGAVDGTVTGERVSLSWVAARDDESVTGYNVYRDGRYLTTVVDTRHVATLGAGESTRFYVTAFDSPTDGSARGFSGRSPEAVFSRQATPPPVTGGGRTKSPETDGATSPERTPTAATRPVARRVSPTAVALSWNAAYAAGGVRGYNVYRDDRYLTTVRDTSFEDDRDVASGRTHDYYVVAFAGRNPTAYGPRSSVVTAPAFVDGQPSAPGPDPAPDPEPTPDPDPTTDPEPTPDPDPTPDPAPTPGASGPPPAPIGLAVLSAAADGVAIAWERPASDVRGYNVYRDDAYVTTVNGVERWTDTAPPVGTDGAAYQVVAFDTDGNFSPYSDELVVRLDDAPPPVAPPAPEPDPDTDPGSPSPSPDGELPSPTGDLPAPEGLATSLVSNDWVEFQWQPVDGAVAYNVYRDGALLYSVDSTKTGGQDRRYWKTTSYVDCDYTRFLVCIGQRPEPGAVHVYAVTAIDADGGEGAVSAELPVQLLENERLDVRATLEDFRLVVEDEFDGDALDLDRWNTRLPWGPDVTINGEQQYFVDIGREPDFGYDPFESTGDTLRMTGIETPPALADEANGLPFLSGAITTRDSFNFTYGYVEARMKVAKGSGKLSSFFLFHQWAALNAAEIDITEYLGEKPDAVSQNYHWRDERDDATQHPSPTMFEERPGEPFHADFHTYGVLWEPELVVWTIDGEEILRMAGPQVSRQASYVILYLVMGSAWTESPDPDDADFDVPFEIDWLRVWQRPEFIR